jgi:hypothetical protein
MSKGKEHDIGHVVSAMAIKEANGMDYRKDLVEGLEIMEKWVNSPEGQAAFAKQDQEQEACLKEYVESHGMIFSDDPKERIYQGITVFVEEAGTADEQALDHLLGVICILSEQAYPGGIPEGQFPELEKTWPLYDMRDILGQATFLCSEFEKIMGKGDVETEARIIRDLCAVYGFGILVEK